MSLLSVNLLLCPYRENPILSVGGGGMVFFLQEFVKLGHSKAVLQISMSYNAWNWSKSLCAGGGGVVVT